MRRYLFTEMVEKIFYYTGNELNSPKYNGLLSLAKIIEENKLKIHEHVHNLKASINLTDNQLNGSDPNFSSTILGDSILKNAVELSATTTLINRSMEHLWEPLKDLLQPVWKVYWSEGCNGYNSIQLWLEKADADNGVKVKHFLTK